VQTAYLNAGSYVLKQPVVYYRLWEVITAGAQWIYAGCVMNLGIRKPVIAPVLNSISRAALGRKVISEARKDQIRCQA